MAARFARLINNCIIIYNNNSGKTFKIVYIPIILLPNIIWQYFDAAFLLKPLKSTVAYSVIDVNNEVKLTIQKLASQPIKLTEYNQPDPKESHSFKSNNVMYSMNCLQAI